LGDPPLFGATKVASALADATFVVETDHVRCFV